MTETEEPESGINDCDCISVAGFNVKSQNTLDAGAA